MTAIDTSTQNLRLVAIEADGTLAAPAKQPPAVAQSVCQMTVQMYRLSGFQKPWIGYLAFRGDEAVGGCGFKSAPSDGRVEIAYFTFAGLEGKGLATEMARQLVAIAREAAPGVAVMAQTMPQENSSTSVLKKCGFTLTGAVQSPDDGTVWEWVLRT